MKQTFLIALLLCTTIVTSQSLLGQWRTIDDETGEEKSVVEVFEKDGEIFGKVVKILRPEKRDALCVKCEGDEKNKPVLGLTIIKNMKPSGKYYKEGTIFDPTNGKKYTCRLFVDSEDPDKLQVRGYIGFLYSTQYWLRVK
jgi:uncharacterized protein (DUF2147 family)